jgi:energy-coupling factor transport system permease protein
MFKNISLGIYYPGNSFIHRLQARTKLLILLWFIIFLLVANHREWHFAPYVVIALLAGIGVALSGIAPGHIWQRTRLLVLLAVIGAIPTVIFTEGDPLYKIGPWHTPFFLLGPIVITRDGIWLLMSLFTVFLVLYVFSLLLTMTTTPVVLIEGMTRLINPLRRFGLPVDDFALMTLIALRFIPTLTEEIEQLFKAQTARGADLTQGTFNERFQSVAMLFLPLMQGTLRRAADLSTALEARGFESEARRTLLHERVLGKVDYMVLGVVVLVTAGALVL